MKYILVLLLCGGMQAFAEDAERGTNPEASDTDNIITNVKMRAESGSKSKYSIASSLSYNTGSLEKPFGEKRGNLSGAAGSTDYTSLTGSLSGKYTLNAQESLFGGFGVRWITPTSADTPKGHTKVDADNPYLKYQYLYRWLGMQASFVFSQSYYTNANQVKNGYVTGTAISQYTAYDFGGSRFSVGAIPYLNLGFFNKHSAAKKATQSDYGFGVTPFVEYRVTDRLNVRTDTNVASFEHIRSEENDHTYFRQRVIQTFSVGYAITRDIYISPGVLWVVADPRNDRTTTWISSSINIF